MVLCIHGLICSMLIILQCIWFGSEPGYGQEPTCCLWLLCTMQTPATVGALVLITIVNSQTSVSGHSKEPAGNSCCGCLRHPPLRTIDLSYVLQGNELLPIQTTAAGLFRNSASYERAASLKCRCEHAASDLMWGRLQSSLIGVELLKVPKLHQMAGWTIL